MVVSNPGGSQWELYCTGTGSEVALKELMALPTEAQAALLELAVRFEDDRHRPAEFGRLPNHSVSVLKKKLAGDTYRLFFGTHTPEGKQEERVLVAVSIIKKKSAKGITTQPFIIKKAEKRFADWLKRNA